MTEYKREYKPKKMTDLTKKIQPNEIQLIPSTINYLTSNNLNFAPPTNNKYNEHPFLIKAKINNLGPNVCKIPFPINSNTTYKNDYPDWNCVGAKQMPRFVPNTIKKNMPFMGKPVNREYGSFHARGDYPEPREGCFPDNKNHIFPVLENMADFPMETEHQRNFNPKSLGDDPLKDFKPVHNLELEVI